MAASSSRPENNGNRRTPTGIPGLDKLLSGGLPKGRIILLTGGPGTGKTILSSQYLVNGIMDYDENGVYVSLDENKQHVFEEMVDFGWDLPELEHQKRLIFLEASPIRYLPAEIKVGRLTVGRKEFSMATLVEMIKTSVKEIDAKRIVVDPVTTLVFQYDGVVNQRNALVELIEALADTGATCIITTELRRPGFERNVDYEEYLAHGVVLLQQLQVGKSLLRVIQIEKMRKTPVDNQPRPYRITDSGIEVFPRESVL
jgi:KaiC/GvpD/RAD55 family RecA-like ATPase